MAELQFGSGNKNNPMRKKLTGIIVLVSINFWAGAQTLPVPKDIGSSHPRAFGKDMTVAKVKVLAEKEEWAQEIIDKTTDRLDKYIELYQKDSTWLVSRLQMYWKSKATQVYINGGVYSHAEGKAPAPTVRYPGTRDHRTDYKRPKLEDILPFMDDPRGLYLQHKDRPGQWEWTAISETGRITESINREIVELARDAAFLYWYTGEDIYAGLAYGILDTYLTGIYYLNEPKDLSHGHHQTLVGYTSFEVIQEHHIEDVTQCYDFLYQYIVTKHPDKLEMFAKTFQKWADQQIKNGVSFNNWNLFQASHISKIALVLENNSYYENGKGAQYYLDQILNHTSTRQWSMTKLINYGYDPETGIWNESPGYSMGVLKDFIRFAKFYDRSFGIDLVEDIPVIKKAVKSSVQYLYPNGYKVSFGDGHYSKLSPEPIMYMIKNAQKYGKEEDEIYFTKMLKSLFDKDVYNGEFTGKRLSDLFFNEPFKIREDVSAGALSDFVSPLFYAPNTSWLVQRQGKGESGLMISQIGSLGNHMHSNGIAMELYGYGLPLAPEMGHGSSYFSIEYAEYYTQFPAHNTVIVNGRSKYPEMKSNHAFERVAAYPESQQKEGNIPGFTFSDVKFLEPETNSDQRRVMGIIKNGASTGYYIDIFRSQQNTGDNIKHEYFYHNLGQELILTDKERNVLALKPTTKLAFGNGDLMAYDYMWNKRSIQSDQDFRGQFNLKMDDKTISMNLWMKGEEDREIFSVLSPKSTAFRHGPLPNELAEAPIPTLIVRQEGEAWTRPFVAVYEPALNEGSSILSVDYFGNGKWIGIHVSNESERQDFIFSSPSSDKQLLYQDMLLEGTYGVISKDHEDFTLFLAQGNVISLGDYQLQTAVKGAAALKKAGEEWHIMAEVPVTLTLPVEETKQKIMLQNVQGEMFKGTINKKEETVSFELPAMMYNQVELIHK